VSALPSIINARSFRAWYQEGLEGPSEFAWVERIATRVDSDQPMEDFRWLGQVPAVAEFTGNRRESTPREQSHIVEVKVFDLTQSFKQDDINDGKFGMIERKVRAMPKRGRQHRASLLTDYIEAGGGTTLGTTYLGGALYSDSHSEGASGTLDNNLAYTVASTSAPTAAEMEGIINAQTQNYYTMKDDEAQPLNEDMGSVTVMVPVKYRNAAKTALGAEVIVEGGASRTSLLRVVNDDLVINLVVNPRLTAANNIVYSFRDDVTEGAFVYLVREDMDTPRFVDDTAKHRKVLYIMEGRYAMAYGMYQYTCRTTLST